MLTLHAEKPTSQSKCRTSQGNRSHHDPSLHELLGLMVERGALAHHGETLDLQGLACGLDSHDPGVLLAESAPALSKLIFGPVNRYNR